MYSRKHLLKRLMSIEAHSLSENLLLEIKKSKRICNPENYLKAANITITNLLVQGSVRIGRGHTKFPAVSKRYGLEYYTPTYILRIVDEMKRQEYLEQNLGYGNMKDDGKVTLLKPTYKLLKEFNTVTIGEVLLKEEIELRDKKESTKKRGRRIDYSDYAFTEQIREEVKFINEAIKSVPISLVQADKRFVENFPISIFNSVGAEKPRRINQNLFLKGSSSCNYLSSPLEPGQSSLNIEIRNVFNGFRRIFTGGNFAFGGRYYDVGCFSYQSIKKGIRANILIDG